MNITIMTIVNDNFVYNDFLKNLESQINIKYDLIAIDNSKNQYTSARIAFNENIWHATGEYLVFMHPDTRFISETSLADIISYVIRLEPFGVIGVAGCPEKLYHGKRIILSNIVHGSNKVNAGIHIDEPVPVQTVDECLFIVKRGRKEIFSNKVGWHLYAVELCLNKLIEGKKNYVVPANVWHMSDGKSLDYKYIVQLKDIIVEYGGSFSTINTTIKKWDTRGIKSFAFLHYYFVKQYIKEKIMR